MQPLPLYKQIAQQIELSILNGEIDAGAILPTERDLALRLGVNRSTVTTAYNELRQSGLVYSKQGSGTVVSDHLWDIVPRKLINWHNSRNVTFSPTNPLTKRIIEASKHPETINLVNGTTPYQIPSEQSKNIYDNFHQYLNVSSTHVDWKTRELLSSHLQKDWGIPAKSNEILLTSGIQQTMLLLIQCLLNPGDAVAIECPSFTYTVKLFSSLGIKIVRLPVGENGIDPGEIRHLYKKHRIKMVFTTPTYQNPTGTILPLGARVDLISICKELRIPIIEFNCTSPLTHSKDVQTPPSLYSLDESKEIVIHTGTFTDTLGPGVELGWILGGHSVFEILRDAKYQLGLGPSQLTLQFVCEFLEKQYWEKNINQFRSTLYKRKKSLLLSLEKHVGQFVSYSVPTGGLNLWAKLNLPLKSDRELIEACIHRGVIVLPGTIYGAEQGNIRISISSCTEDQIDEGMRRFSEALRNIKSFA